MSHTGDDVERRLVELEERTERMERNIDSILRILERAGGGWRVLVVIGTLITGAAMVISAVSSVGNWMRH